MNKAGKKEKNLWLHNAAVAILAVSLAMTLCFGSVPAAAGSHPRNADGVEYEWQYKNREDGTVEIIGYENVDYEGVLTIPARLDGKTVTGISGLGNMKNVTSFAVESDDMPFGTYQGVLFVKKGNILLFYPLAREGSAYDVPPGVRTIGPSAFEGSGLENIGFPDTLLAIGNSAFAGCDGLTVITIPDSVITIGDYAFSRCRGLRTVVLGDGVTTAGDSAFAFCDELESITIGNGLQSVGKTAFAGGTSLEKILIRDDHPFLRLVDDVLFSRDGRQLLVYPAGKAGDAYEVPDGTETIEAYAFSGARNIHRLTIPDSVRTIGELAFTRMEHLEDVRLGENVRSLGDYAFWGDGSLKQLMIPAGVEEIGKDALPEGNVTVHAGSYAEAYCKSNGIQYTQTEENESLQAAPDTEGRTSREATVVPAGRVETAGFIAGHGPEYLVDGDQNTSFQIRRTTVDEREAWIVFSFDDRVMPDEMWIRNGCWETVNGMNQYTRSSRVRQMTIDYRYSDYGKYQDSQTVALEDSGRTDWTVIPLKPLINVSAVRIRIDDIFEGTKFPDDVCISDIRFVKTASD